LVQNPRCYVDGLASLLYQHSEGNPLFMVTALDDMTERGLISRNKERWQLRVALKGIDLGVPKSLQQMIEAQIDRLEILGDKGAIRLDGARLTCSGVSPQERGYDLATEYQGSYNRTIAHFVQSLRDNTPFETAPQDNLETLRLVEDCYRLSGWEALP